MKKAVNVTGADVHLEELTGMNWLELSNERCFERRNKCKTSSNGAITLAGKAGEKLKFKYTSLVKDGILTFQLTDKKGTVVETFESGISSSKTIKFNQDAEYILSATYEDFIGSYKIKVTR